MKKLMGLTLTLVLPALFVAAMAGAEPATPAVPGGGNPNANSDNAATPAVPGAAMNMPGPGDMQADEAGKFTEANAGLKEEARAKWDAMTPEEKKQFMTDHHKLRKAMFRKKWDKMTPAERGAFMDAHPEMKEKMKARWEAMTPEERQAFLANHPKIEKRWKKQHRESRAEGGADMENRGEKAGEGRKGIDKKGNNGVRDHGQGAGRNGAGQGKGRGKGPGRK